MVLRKTSLYRGQGSLFLAGQVLFKHVFSAAVKLEQEESHAKIDIDKIKR